MYRSVSREKRWGEKDGTLINTADDKELNLFKAYAQTLPLKEIDPLGFFLIQKKFYYMEMK
jgi:hypothetical protein